jgi:starch synthase
MKILLACSEVHPFSKTGGLADMAGALAKTLAQQGHRVGLVTPFYKGLRERFPKIRNLKWKIELPLGSRSVTAGVWVLQVKKLTVYFIRQPEFFERRELYQEQGREYPDNAERFIFFSKCVVHLARHLPWQPELVHAHDWQTGLVPLLVYHEKLQEAWPQAPRTAFTVHNLAYQGDFPAAAYALTNLPSGYLNMHAVEFYGNMSCLKAGIVFADVITTVSPRYAREIMTKEFGCGLDGVLRQRRESVYGILNGVDYSEWKTTRNPFLKHSFGAGNLRGKTECKRSLQGELGLPISLDTPLFCTIGRLVDQKGVDILLAALEKLLPGCDLQFVLLGSGSPFFEAAYTDLARRYPRQVAVIIGFDQVLAHRIEAGGDFFLMPSRYEPCGLNQMYSKRYGTIPIVRVTGGLDDSVVDAAEDAQMATGIKFTDFSAEALTGAMLKALGIFADPELLRHYRVNCMEADFSWERTGEQYLRIYELALAQ